MVSVGFGIHSGKIIALDIDKDGEELFTAEYLDGESEVTLTLTSTLTLTLKLTFMQTHPLRIWIGSITSKHSTCTLQAMWPQRL